MRGCNSISMTLTGADGYLIQHHIMKITSNTFKPEVSPTKPRSTLVDDSKTRQPNTSVEDGNKTSRAELIQRLFLRAGVQPRQPGSDFRGRQQAVDRRKEVAQLHKLENLQAILDIATTINVRQINEEEIDPDWFFAFVGLAENVYSAAMQELWGKILAVEVASPGSFSLPSLHIITHLTQREAGLFARAASMAMRNHDHIPRLIVGYHQKRHWFGLFQPAATPAMNLAQYQLSYPDLLTLIDLKLIFASEIESSELTVNHPTNWKMGTQRLLLTARRPGLALVYYKFTYVGAELAKLISKTAAPEYLEGLTRHLAPHFELTTEG